MKQEFYPNGTLSFEEYIYYDTLNSYNGLICQSFDSISRWYDNGILAMRYHYENGTLKKSYLYTRTGRLKMFYENRNDSVFIKNFGNNGEILPSGDINHQETGYRFCYDDDGQLEEKAYYRKGQYIRRKSIKVK